MKKAKNSIMGLPGAGKTYLANVLHKILGGEWINADKVRGVLMTGFQSKWKKETSRKNGKLADEAIEKNNYVIVDFVCPTPQTSEFQC